MSLVVFNQKGGVGKSTITCNLAAISAWNGWRTLVVDLDPQGNSTHYLLGQTAEEAELPTLGDFYEQTLKYSLRPKPVADFIVETPWDNLHLLASAPRLEELQAKLESRHKIYKLREALAEIEVDYDHVYVDTPPALNFYTRSALIAATSCLIPFDCDEFSRRAVYTLLDNVKEIQADHNSALQVAGIVVNQFQSRANLPQRMVDELIAEGLPVLEPYLSASVRMKESHELATPMIYLEPNHKLTLELIGLHAAVHG